jgi:leader peptidase (prepilin peptidase)/N-methyltransferase
MEIFLIIIFAFLGGAVGSFLNVCIDRLPASKSLVFPPSHCDTCQRKLSFLELVPVLSFLALRGRCRSCGMRIPRRVFWVELGTAFFFTFSFWYYGWTIPLATTLLYGSLFIVIMVIDLEHNLILNRITYPAIVLALIIDALLPEPGIVMGVLGAGVGFIMLLLPALVFRGGMGWGDVKLATLIGAVTGFPLVFVALLVGIIGGGFIAIALLITGRKKRHDTLPFGTFLALATIVTLFWGNDLLNWYVRFFNL